MKGLIIKDLLYIKGLWKIVVGLFLFYIAISIMDGTTSFIFFSIAFLSVFIVLSTLSYDDVSKWDKCALSMPVNRKTIVLSKYIFSGGLIVFGGVLAVSTAGILNFFGNSMDITENLWMIYTCPVICIIFISICIPLTCKFGVEKSRIIFIPIAILPMLIVTLVQKKGVPLPSEKTIMSFIKLFPLIGILFLIVSYFMCLKIYNNKEF